jgi:uroporphyrin-III C-methyltransferase/precorrin-2 dehydrogenase/sirohydrochlorin ferrochelatase
VPVNVIDKPAFCDFSFGSIVNRSPLVIGISTDGAAPVFAQAVRAKLEALIPLGFARWADAARRWRRAVQSSGLSFPARRRFWQVFTAQAVTRPDHEPAAADFDAYMAVTREGSAAAEHGSVTLVGAGPGDPELLTLRAVRALQSADVILIDDLVAPGVLDFARREAKKMLVGKTGYGPSCKQEEINALMISLARAGKRVVRLKGGDPMIFGRASEEIEACREAGIAVEVVPGISAAQGAASRLGISLTHRKVSRRVQFVTGHAADGHLPTDIDWQSLADPAATTIVYMPGKTIRELADTAIAHGLAPDTPTIAVASATRPEQEVIAGTIADIADRVREAAPSGPLLVMIGRALADAAGAEVDASGEPTPENPSANGRMRASLGRQRRAAPCPRAAPPRTERGSVETSLFPIEHCERATWARRCAPLPTLPVDVAEIGTAASLRAFHQTDTVHRYLAIEISRRLRGNPREACHDDEPTQYRANPARGGELAA